MNKKKCIFGQTSMEYLKHIISTDDMAANPKKLEAMWLWPTPKFVKGLRGLFSLTGYYRCFVKDYGKLAKPLNSLLNKNDFQWDDAAQTAFEQLKSVVTTLPTLVVPDFTNNL